MRRIGKAAMIFVVGSLVFSTLAPGQDKTPAPPQGAAELTVRGPNEAIVGQRFTLEFLITNPAATALDGLELLVKIDAALEQESKAPEHRTAIAAIPAENLHIVRLGLTAQKAGPAGVDITLRAKNGETQQIRHVLPVFAEGDAPAQPKRLAGTSPLHVTITPPKEFFADRPGIFLIYVLNTDSKPSENKLELVVSAKTTSNLSLLQLSSGSLVPSPGPKVSSGGTIIGHSNPMRQTRLSLPILAPREGRTLPVTLSPGRIGEFRVSVASPVPGGNLQELAVAAMNVQFDPKASVKNLVPAAPSAGMVARLPRTFAEVPEVALEGSRGKDLKADEAFEHVAHMMEKINHVNTKKPDAFVEALMKQRPDVGGLPFAMGDSCRLKADRGVHFVAELTHLRLAMANPAGRLAEGLPSPSTQATNGQIDLEQALPARVAALMQVLGPESTELRKEMVAYLTRLSHNDGTRALASLAVFSAEEPIRQAAVEALKGRHEKDYTDVLLRGLSYPWPAAAQHAGDAIAKLKRNDLIPSLVDALEAPDPRAPQVREVEGKKSPVVRELVRVNHLRNCLLCHPPAAVITSPANQGQISLSGSLAAAVPLPGEPLPTPTPRGGYGSFSIPDTQVRFDVTYLRQDFSVKLPVADAKPWPEAQRFDFLVRTRTISEQEAKAYRDLLRPAGAGDLSPYQRAAVAALRELTGRDTEPTAPAWRRLLEQIKAERKKG